MTRCSEWNRLLISRKGWRVWRRPPLQSGQNRLELWPGPGLDSLEFRDLDRLRLSAPIGAPRLSSLRPSQVVRLIPAKDKLDDKSGRAAILNLSQALARPRIVIFAECFRVVGAPGSLVAARSRPAKPASEPSIAVPAHAKRWSNSLCVPIQIHSIVSPERTPTARYCSLMRTDQRLAEP